MTEQLSPVAVQKFFGNDGQPLAYGRLTTYAAGTTIKQATYIDSTGLTPNTNPIILSAFGTCALWLDPALAYKFVLTDQFGNMMPGYPVDNIPGSPIVGVQSIFTPQVITAIANQTSFTISSAATMSNAIVVLNGAVLIPTTDYLIGTSTLLLTTPAAANDILMLLVLSI